MSIELVKIRAVISIGSSFTVRTPYIQSFNVRKVRNQVATFDASLKISQTELAGTSGLGGSVKIDAGTKESLITIFTGIMKKATVSPCWDDPGYVLLNISGVDVLSTLAGKKYTRRSRITKSCWVSINGVVREGLRDGKFQYETDSVQISPDSAIPGDKENTSQSFFQAASTVVSSSAVETILTTIKQEDPTDYA